MSQTIRVSLLLRSPQIDNLHVAVGQKQWYHFGVGAFTTHVGLLLGLNRMFTYDLDFDPWPCVAIPRLGL